MLRPALGALAVGGLMTVSACSAHLRIASASTSSAVSIPPPTTEFTDGRWSWELFKSPDGFTKVSARWTVPTANCRSGETGYMYSWVGLGGWDRDAALEQIGTLEGCYQGMRRYRSFWEFYPARPAFGDDPTRGVDDYPVASGDVMTATVAQGFGGRFQLTEANMTEGWTLTRTGASPAYSPEVSSDGSKGPGNTTAEVVHEEATSGQFELPDYGTVIFSQLAPTSLGGAAITPYLIRTVSGLDLTQQTDADSDRVTVTWVRRS
jgi:hypothetical protein